MKEIFERHKQQLSASEKRAVWETISSRRAARSPRRWAVPALAGAAGMIILAILVIHHGPAPVGNLPATKVPNAIPRMGEVAPSAIPAPRASADRGQAAPDLVQANPSEPKKMAASPAGPRGAAEPQGAAANPRKAGLGDVTPSEPSLPGSSPAGSGTETWGSIRGGKPPAPTPVPPSLAERIQKQSDGARAVSPEDLTLGTTGADKPPGSAGGGSAAAPGRPDRDRGDSTARASTQKTNAPDEAEALTPAAPGDRHSGAALASPPRDSGAAGREAARRQLVGAAAPAPASAPPVSPSPSGSAAGTGSIAGKVTDDTGKPLAFANVMIVGTALGAMSQQDGSYRIPSVAEGVYSLKVSMLGYEEAQVDGVEVWSGRTANADFAIRSRPVSSLSEVEVIPRKSVAPKSDDRLARIRGLASSGSDQSASPPASVRTKEGSWGGIKHEPGGTAGRALFGGSQGGEKDQQLERLRSLGYAAGPSAPPVQPPSYPISGGSVLPNDESFDSMFFRHYGVNPFVSTDEDSLSTFAVDVDNASYTVARRYLELGHLPPMESARLEEYVNYFPQGYPKFRDDDMRIFVDGAPSPFQHGIELLRVGLQAREIRARDLKPANLTFLIDVSGSMSREGRLDLVKNSLRLLVDQLRAGDRVGLVVFSTRARDVLEPVTLGEPRRDLDDRARGDRDESPESSESRKRILDALARLAPENSTNVEDGLRLAYEMARSMYQPEANNRIVMFTDGVANEGDTGAESILRNVRRDSDRGIALSAIGVGMGNYNDVLLEQLADKGDGNYYYVDDLKEAERVLVENLTGTLQTVARDAKIQVEFDPSRVVRFRLLGFENRYVADRDFRNDKVDAGEIGAGNQVTALYEVKLAPGVGRGRIATARLRYIPVTGRDRAAPPAREIETSFDAADLRRDLYQASPHLCLDAAVAQFAEILRGSYWARESRIEDLLPLARHAAKELKIDSADEFLALAEKAADLNARISPPEQAQQETPPDWERRQWEWRREQVRR